MLSFIHNPNIINLRKHIFLAGLFLAIAFSSCRYMAVYLFTKKDITDDVKILYNKQKDRTLIVLPIIHLSKKGYYESVKNIIDSLRSEGYTFFYEGMDMQQGLDSIQAINYKRKLRKFLKVNLDFHKENLSLPSFYHSKYYIKQDYHKIGIIKEQDINIDLSLKAVIDSFETKYFEITLNDCDLNTDLNAKYQCKNNYARYRNSIIHEFRNPFLCQTILESKHQKLVIVYGKSHWMYIYPLLRDNGYELVQGKL